MSDQEFVKRKKEHIQQALEDSNQALGKSRLSQTHLIHEALPELDWDEVDISTRCLGKKLKTPFNISGMTAGHPQAIEINQILANACESRGWVFGVGSQRRDLTDLGATDRWKEFRKRFPHLVLVGNLGISQLIRTSLKDIRRVVDLLQPNALAIHANALQEVIQIEGTPQFRGCFQALKKLTRELKCPVVLKETGCGFSEGTLRRIAPLKLAAVDVSGLGGTHWGRIEGARAESTSTHALASKTFENWGESTVNSVISGRKTLAKSTELWASGGIRNGLDAAKLIALGAHRVGYAKPALEALLRDKASSNVSQNEKALLNWMEQQEFELKTALFCTGYADLKLLRKAQPVVVDGRFLGKIK